MKNNKGYWGFRKFMEICNHETVFCLNQYELIRKYRCEQCGEVMMCKCEEEIGIKFLPHQIYFGTDSFSKEQIKVTLGFQNKVCNTCRGLPEEPHPKSEIFGATSKIKRYYWREITLETIKRFGKWAEEKGQDNWLKVRHNNDEVFKRFEKDVIEEIKIRHKINPIYKYSEISENEFLKSCGIKPLYIKASIDKTIKTKKKYIGNENKLLTPEEFISIYYKQKYYEVIFTESKPFHTIFAVFMWILHSG